jgi:hypothetical protein
MKETLISIGVGLIILGAIAVGATVFVWFFNHQYALYVAIALFALLVAWLFGSLARGNL